MLSADCVYAQSCWKQCSDLYLHPWFPLPLPSCVGLSLFIEELGSYKYLWLDLGCGNLCLGVGSARVTIR